MSLARNQAVFQVGPVVLFSRLIEGQFPSWRQLIPESFEHQVRLQRAELLDVARRISQLAQRNAPLRFAFAEGELTVAAETPEVGDASEALPAPYSGEALEIAFNPQFLIEGLESIDTDELVIKLSSPLRPGLLAAGRPRGLQLPRDADPPQRVVVPTFESAAADDARVPGMLVTGVAVRGFRNLSAQEVDLGDGLTLLWGANGAGKTNLLEAVCVALCRTLVPDAQRAGDGVVRRAPRQGGGGGEGGRRATRLPVVARPGSASDATWWTRSRQRKPGRELARRSRSSFPTAWAS